MSSIDVMVIDPNRLCRQGLRHVFAETCYRVSFEFDYVDDAIEAIERGERPHLVLLDATEPDDADAVQALRGALPDVPLSLLTSELDSSRLKRLMEAGVDAFLLKDLSASALERYLNLIMVGEKVFPTRLAAEVLNERTQDHVPHDHQSSPNGLSRREVQIVELLLDGQPNKVIANALGITEATVKVHLKAIMKKTRAANRTQVAIWGLNNGLSKRQSALPVRSAHGNDRMRHSPPIDRSGLPPLRTMFTSRVS